LALQEQLNSAMSNLMTDNDRDVSRAARTVHDTFKRTALRVTGGAGLLEMNGSSSGARGCEIRQRLACKASKQRHPTHARKTGHARKAVSTCGCV
jgi:hypothetical protein